MKYDIEDYVAFQHPCIYSTPERPRGGCIMFIKKHLVKFVEGVDKNFNDAVIVYMSGNIIICGFYIPPRDSKYYDDNFDTLETLSVYDRENPRNIIICGDLNSRMGTLGKLNSQVYQDNTDTEVNQHGRRLLQICKSNKLIPLNMLEKDERNFRGGFTFCRGNLKSQNDWMIVSKDFVQHVTNFNFIDSLSNVSDHLPIKGEFHLDVSVTLDQIDESIKHLCEQNNHSKFRKFKMENINPSIFSNTLNTYIAKIKENQYENADMLARDIDISLRKSADVSNI